MNSPARLRGLAVAALAFMCLLATACGAAHSQALDAAERELAPAAALAVTPPSASSLFQPVGPDDPIAPPPLAVQSSPAAVPTPSIAFPTQATPGGTDTSASPAPAAHWGAAPTPAVTAQPAVAAVASAPAVAQASTGLSYHSVATYYGADFQGRPMASGPLYNMMDPTIAASDWWPLGTRLQVWRVPGGPWDGLLSADERAYFFGHSIIVTVLDRGLFTHALDLSYGAFSLLGRPSEGLIAIIVQPLDGTPARWQLPQ